MLAPSGGGTSENLFRGRDQESETPGYEPSLRGVMLQEGRAASGGRKELFAPGSVSWPHDGVAILTEHHGKAETRGTVVREAGRPPDAHRKGNRGHP